MPSGTTRTAAIERNLSGREARMFLSAGSLTLTRANGDHMHGGN